MNQTDKIREYIVKNFIDPARRRGLKQVTIRAGDVHKDMHLVSRMPSVCGALDSLKLLELANVSIIRREGPAKGANVYVTFSLEGKAPEVPAEVAPESRRPKRTLDIDPSTTLIVVSCVKRKKSTAAKAKDLYDSDLFKSYKNVVRSTGARWLILSAKYGLVEPEAVLHPYEQTLNHMGVAERRKWAKRVLDDLLPIARNYDKVVFLAGKRYREFLIQPLRAAGLTIDIPMEGLRQGEQLSWLKAAA